MHERGGTREDGFTIIELVATLVIVGILAAVAGPRFAGVNVFERQGFIAESESALRYAHKLAAGSGCAVRVRFGTDCSGTAFQGVCLQRWTGTDCNDRSATTAPIAHPRGGVFELAAPSGVAVTSGDFFFDRIGRPRDDSSGALLTAPLAFSVGGEIVTVEAETGLVR